MFSRFKAFRPQFGVKTLLWTMLLISAVITAYRSGFQAGFSQGGNYRKSLGTTYVTAYNVADLVTFDPATTSDLLYADDLIDDLCKNVLPMTWQEQGGAAAVSGYANAGVIVISHDREGHSRIADYLQQRRNMLKTAKN